MIQNQNESGQWIVRLLVLVSVLPVLYVASLGPAVWLDDQGLLPDYSSPIFQAIEVFYQPLLWLMEESGTGAGDVLRDYVNLFDG